MTWSISEVEIVSGEMPQRGRGRWWGGEEKAELPEFLKEQTLIAFR